MSKLFLAFVTVIAFGVVVESANSISQATSTNYTASLIPQAASSLVLQAGMADQIVVYSATWCAHCQRLSPVLLSLKQEGYKVVHRDVDRDIDALKYDYDAVPTIYFVRKNVVIRTETGYRSKEHIKQTLMPDSPPKPR
jgi:thiol-disulfide isomerase/thioredoxin